ncbi:hypothetical protein RJ640_013969 [Escallonia rubra]|uniref:Uncharacterized protein n=1 Tax=Escallonia rubra TaxID=112253 RepID=A0AA88QUQ0_9ASTE|nr:hypothetical protein RJ640_013969 [Escallonia rubra]
MDDSESGILMKVQKAPSNPIDNVEAFRPVKEHASHFICQKIPMYLFLEIPGLKNPISKLPPEEIMRSHPFLSKEFGPVWFRTLPTHINEGMSIEVQNFTRKAHFFMENGFFEAKERIQKITPNHIRAIDKDVDWSMDSFIMSGTRTMFPKLYDGIKYVDCMMEAAIQTLYSKEINLLLENLLDGCGTAKKLANERRIPASPSGTPEKTEEIVTAPADQYDDLLMVQTGMTTLKPKITWKKSIVRKTRFSVRTNALKGSSESWDIQSEEDSSDHHSNQLGSAQSIASPVPEIHLPIEVISPSVASPIRDPASTLMSTIQTTIIPSTSEPLSIPAISSSPSIAQIIEKAQSDKGPNLVIGQLAMSSAVQHHSDSTSALI